MGKIVDPGQQPKGKEKEHHTQQLGEGPPGLRKDLPALKQLHKQAGQDPKLRAGWPHLLHRQERDERKPPKMHVNIYKTL